MKLYVLVRDDLQTQGYKAVQAGHAVAGFMMHYPGAWKNETLVYLRVKNESELIHFLDKFDRASQADAHGFVEPDLGNEWTAVAACGLSVGRMVRSLPLL